MTSTLDVRYAGFWRRLGAGLVDVVLFIPVTYGLVTLEGRSLPAAIGVAVLGQALYYAYTLPLTHQYGGTLGKLAVGIRVTPVDGETLMWRHVWRRSAVDLVASGLLALGAVTALSRVTFASYATAPWSERYVLLEAAVPWYAWVNNVYLAWLVSEFIVLLLNRRRRALHDFIAGTVVVVTRSSVPEHAGAPARLPAS